MRAPPSRARCTGRSTRCGGPDEADYESFAELVGRIDDIPTYLPWPMSPGWSIADFGCVGPADRVRATVTTTVGTSDLDGEVEVTIVSEDPGIGLGARCAGTSYDDPGPQISNGPALDPRPRGRPDRADVAGRGRRRRPGADRS